MPDSKLAIKYADAVKAFKAGKVTEDIVIKAANIMRADFGMSQVTTISQLIELRDYTPPPLITPAPSPVAHPSAPVAAQPLPEPIQTPQTVQSPIVAVPVQAPVPFSVPDPAAILLNKRREILNKAIFDYAKRGWVLTVQTDTTAQMIKPKRFSLLIAIIMTFLLIGIILYVLYYLTKRDQFLFLSVDEKCKLKVDWH